MNWILEHLQLVIAGAGAIAWWLNQRRRVKDGEAVAPQEETTFEDPELAERTRRIREEIQRKIQQRAGTYTSPQPDIEEASEPVAPPVIREVARHRPELPFPSRAAAMNLEAQRTAEILEQQAALSEQLRQAAEMKAASLRRIQYENQISSGDEAAAVARGALGDDLRNPASLRRAFILREIIGPPVALR